jgi:hypothetical protein
MKSVHVAAVAVSCTALLAAALFFGLRSSESDASKPQSVVVECVAKEQLSMSAARLKADDFAADLEANPDPRERRDARIVGCTREDAINVECGLHVTSTLTDIKAKIVCDWTVMVYIENSTIKLRSPDGEVDGCRTRP